MTRFRSRAEQEGPAGPGLGLTHCHILHQAGHRQSRWSCKATGPGGERVRYRNVLFLLSVYLLNLHPFVHFNLRKWCCGSPCYQFSTMRCEQEQGWCFWGGPLRNTCTVSRDGSGTDVHGIRSGLWCPHQRGAFCSPQSHSLRAG